MGRIARIICRPQEGEAGLILGACIKGQELFKPGRVYEISSVLDTPIIKEVGPCLIAKEKYTDSPLHLSWAADVNTILACGGGCLFLTKREYEMRNE